MLEDGPFQLLDVRALSHEGEGDEVHLHREAEIQVEPVLVGQGGAGNVHPGKIDSLQVLEDPPLHDRAADGVAGDGKYLQLDQAVIHEDARTGLDISGESPVDCGDQHRPTKNVVGGDGEL